MRLVGDRILLLASAMLYRTEDDSDVLDLIEDGFTERPVELGSDGPIAVISPPTLRENPVREYRGTTEHFARDRRPLADIGGRYLSVAVKRFTDIPKIGLNPQNRYQTPTGLYWYDRELPHADFGSDRKYVIRATLSGVGVDLGSLEDDHVENLISEIGSQFDFRSRSGGRFRADVAWTLSSVLKAIRSSSPVEDDISWFTSNDWLKDRLRLAKERGFDVATARAASMWWGVTRLAAKRLAVREGRKHVDAWTTVFRRLGIDFVYDPGFGIIHNEEPEQIVSFDPRIIADAELDEIKQKRVTDTPTLFKFMPTKYRFREDAKTGLTAKRRIEKEGVRPCEAVEMVFVERDEHSFTRHTVNVGDVVAFADVSVGLRIDMVLHDKVLVSLVRPDGAPLSAAERDAISNIVLSPTFIQCDVFVTADLFGFNRLRIACQSLDNAVVPEGDFRGVDLRYFTFRNCYLRGALFSHAHLGSSVSLDNCYMTDADFTEVTGGFAYLDEYGYEQVVRPPEWVQVEWQHFWPSTGTLESEDTSR